MNLIKKTLFIVSFLVTLAALSGCDNPVSGEVQSGDQLLSCNLPLVPNAAGTACVEPPPLDCEPPTVPNDTNDACVIGYDPTQPDPIVFAAEDEAILFYNRANRGATNTPNDPSYNGYRLHTWNSPDCDAYAPESLAASWDNGLPFAGIDPNYGAYWILKLKPEYGECGNFIIHIGTDDAGKELGGGDWKMPLKQEDERFTRMNWTISGEPAVFEYPITSLGEGSLKIEEARAHWIDTQTIVWNWDTALPVSSEVTSAKLYYSTSEPVSIDQDGNISGTAIDLTEATLTPEQQARVPLLANLPAYSGSWTADEAKAMAKGHVVFVGFDASGEAIVATHVQIGKVLDALYTSGDNDADEASLGISYNGSNIDVALWAPTAQSVNLLIYRDDGVLESRHAMTEDTATGIWHYAAPQSLDRKYYRFELTLYHYATKKFETIESTDPYSVSLSMNGEYSQFVNLADSDLYPDGWQGHPVPTINDPEDAVIYELHVRDFSARDPSVAENHRGRYLAFTETDSNPVRHLSSLVQAGLTHVHLLPVNDIATINEYDRLQVDLDDTVADLCRLNANAFVCGVEDDNRVLQDLIESYGPLSEERQELVDAMRAFDSFNWGYDPKHFNVPEGVYATDPNGEARIREFRAMVKALHELGLRVVIDVVYNHTNSAGLFDNSVFDKVVPGYYHRRDIATGAVTQSTCCNDTELYNRMMDKFMKDSLLLWTEQYGVDGFRFDIMSHGSREQMLQARELVQTVDPDNYFYGEGWYRGDGYDDTSANQDNMAGTEIATFNDRLRDAVRYADMFKDNGDTSRQDIVKLGMAGQLANYVLIGSTGVAASGSGFSPASYALDPADVINYVSKHDNETLWDMLQFQLPLETPAAERVRIANIAAAIPVMSQGIPFLQLGGDMLRSKSLDKNSYDSGDWFNYVDFSMNTNNWNVGLPLAQDNGWRWYASENLEGPSIAELAASANTVVYPNDIQFAHEVFKEFLSIRRDSKLFRLTTEQDIIDRVGFHNLGSNQTHGVIVMSIDDGIGLPDLDPANDAIVVMINATNSEQSHTVPTATGFVLHPTLVNSIDSNMANARFTEGTDEGTFTVPARTMAVFVKPQGAQQGEGLSAYATAGAPDVVPYGSTPVYIRGGMNGWGTGDQMEYVGQGVYRVAINLTAGTNYEFKFASEDWSTVNYGNSDGAVTEGVDKPLVYNAGNLSFTPAVTSEYFFEVNASDPNAPVLRIRNADIYQGTAIYVRGGINGWGTGSQLLYQGNGIYKVIIDIGANTGSQEFKIASEDWSTVDLSFGDGSAVVTEDEPKLLGPGAGMGNMTMDFAASGEYTFILDASNPSLQYLSVHQTQMYGSQTIYLKGSFNGWGNVDELVYQGDSTYQVDMVLTAGNYEFKFANADWSDINYGALADDPVINLGEPKLLYYNAANIQLTIPADGTYRFTVTGPNESAPKITVTPL